VISVENRQFSPPSVFLTLPLKGFPLKLGTGARGQQTRLMGLPDGRKSFKTDLAVQTEYRRVTDMQTDRQTRDDSKGRAYA